MEGSYGAWEGTNVWNELKKTREIKNTVLRTLAKRREMNSMR